MEDVLGLLLERLEVQDVDVRGRSIRPLKLEVISVSVEPEHLHGVGLGRRSANELRRGKATSERRRTSGDTEQR